MTENTNNIWRRRRRTRRNGGPRGGGGRHGHFEEKAEESRDMNCDDMHVANSCIFVVTYISISLSLKSAFGLYNILNCGGRHGQLINY